jgi:hypothetical protein
MANISQAMTKSLLDWALGGATPSAPAGRFCGLSLGAPTSVSSSEVATGSGYARQTCPFAAAGTPASSGTAQNNSAMTFPQFSSSCVISGLFVADTVSSGAGTMLVYGTLATLRTLLSGDQLVVSSGAITVTLS